MSGSPYAETLPESDRKFLTGVVSKGTRPTRDVRRARIILLSDDGNSRAKICKLLGVSVTAVDLVRKRWREEGVRLAIVDRPRSGRPRVLTEEERLRIVALACTEAPTGRARWGVRRLAEEVVTQRLISHAVGRETVRRVLKEHDLKPWKKGRIGASPS